MQVPSDDELDKVEDVDINERDEELETVGELRHSKDSKGKEDTMDGNMISTLSVDKLSSNSDKLIKKFLEDSLSTHDSKEALRKANFLANKNQGKNADKGFVLSSLFHQKL